MRKLLGLVLAVAALILGVSTATSSSHHLRRLGQGRGGGGGGGGQGGGRDGGGGGGGGRDGGGGGGGGGGEGGGGGGGGDGDTGPGAGNGQGGEEEQNGPGTGEGGGTEAPPEGGTEGTPGNGGEGEGGLGLGFGALGLGGPCGGVLGSRLGGEGFEFGGRCSDDEDFDEEGEEGDGEEGGESRTGNIRFPLGMAVIRSRKSFNETYEDLLTMLHNNPNLKVMAEMDHSFNAAGVDMDLPPTQLVWFGNPAIGSPIMAANPRVGIDLPQKMLVWQNKWTSEDGDDETEVYVGYNMVDFLAARHRLDRDTLPQLGMMEAALANLAAGAAGVDAEAVMESARLSRRERRYIRSFDDDTFRSMRSEFDFNTTLTRLKNVIHRSPATLMLEKDHAPSTLAYEYPDLDVSLLPNVLLVFGNPVLGTKLMQAGRTVGIDLPLKMLVYERPDDGAVMVTANAPYFLRERHNLQGVEPQQDAVRKAIFNFLEAATTKDEEEEEEGEKEEP